MIVFTPKTASMKFDCFKLLHFIFCTTYNFSMSTCSTLKKTTDNRVVDVCKRQQGLELLL